MPHILLLSSDAEVYRSILESANLPDLIIEKEPTQACEIIFGAPSSIRKVLNDLPNVHWVQSMWAGVEPLLEPSLRKNYILTNARGVFGQLMSEYILGYLLAHERQIFQLRQMQKEKVWFDFDTGTLRGKTLGLLGVGSIGAEVARTAKFFGMNVRGYTKESEASSEVDKYYHGNDLLEFARGLDYLVSILPNTAETKKIVDGKVLGVLPPHALFINVGRGSAVDEPALLAALGQHKIAGAILDVFEQEPLPEDHPFWEAPNLTMTFHTSAPSLPEDIARVFIENYQLYVEGKPLKYVVDFERGY
ncbi:MAG: D-2-hydroxyacid dehydrogenase [Anaerolineales bacterium]|uniref:D-2-hydroxyacid dehydrogenase n=1 Tax=Candidatus Villigracilis vicinus TaxID=3140679 RepID=UPI003135A4BD|nr:D-2-hydroxyacid dehydrogenase [Anaerolineales bacterium]